ncbi:hypothetical protein [Spirochaeta africana]|uniref:Uncharacterized protein n=1 Tax=Spirochaeta africana (strain ATCC 700263 / DSM 8902 / Z-7692) TaxID=889378 RepID=H9UMK2_SPIAZ|nr:hypothetical protein [Spirochaeta africana]AFG38745.1 hypothetical protein Spiaf_2720 [Spirochaeta africana DSM 8902]
MASVNFCACCGEIIDLPGDVCSFCGYCPAAIGQSSYHEVFDAPLKRLETHAGLLRLDQLLQQLCDLENELTGLLQGAGIDKQISCKP